jgi:hypothetical protein
MPFTHALALAFVLACGLFTVGFLAAGVIGALVSAVREDRRRRRTDILGLRGTIELLNNRHDHTGGQS